MNATSCRKRVSATELPVVVERVEELPNVDLQHPAASESHHLRPEALQCRVGRALGPEAVRRVVELRLVDRLQQHDDGPLEHLVLERGDADRPRTAGAFRNVHASDGRCPVRPGLHLREEPREVGLELRRVGVGRLAIDARSAILPRAPEGFLQPVDVQVVRQGGDRLRADLPRQHCYPLLLR